jgi:hypothetical protein
VRAAERAPGSVPVISRINLINGEEKKLFDTMKVVCGIRPDELRALEGTCRIIANDAAQKFVIGDAKAISAMRIYECGCIVVTPPFARLLLQAHERGLDDGIRFIINHEKGHRANGELKGRFTAEGFLAAYPLDTRRDDIADFVRHVKSEHIQADFGYVTQSESACGCGKQDPVKERGADLYALEKAESPIEEISSALAIIAMFYYGKETTLYRKIRWHVMDRTDSIVWRYMDIHDIGSRFSETELNEIRRETSAKFRRLGDNHLFDLLRY